MFQALKCFFGVHELITFFHVPKRVYSSNGTPYDEHLFEYRCECCEYHEVHTRLAKKTAEELKAEGREVPDVLN